VQQKSELIRLLLLLVLLLQLNLTIKLSIPTVDERLNRTVPQSPQTILAHTTTFALFEPIRLPQIKCRFVLADRSPRAW
jgi:hypothetical protein